MTDKELQTWWSYWTPEAYRFDEYEDGGNRRPVRGWMGEGLESDDNQTD